MSRVAVRAKPWFGAYSLSSSSSATGIEGRIGAQRLLKPSIAREVVDGAREHRGRRHVRGDQQLPQAAGHELVLERLAVHSNGEQGADDVLPRVERRRLAGGDDLPALGVEVLVLALRRLDVEVRLRVLEPIAARVELARVVARQVKELREDEAGKRRADLRHELAASGCDERLDQLDGDLSDRRLERDHTLVAGARR